MAIKRKPADPSVFKFRAKHFHDLLESQSYKCYYSGRELTPANTQAVHKTPLAKGGKHEFENIALVDRHAYYLKRYITSDELFQLALDVVRESGKKYGYRAVKRPRKN